MITHKHAFLFKNCERYDYDYEMNLFRHKLVHVNKYYALCTIIQSYFENVICNKRYILKYTYT